MATKFILSESSPSAATGGLVPDTIVPESLRRNTLPTQEQGSEDALPAAHDDLAFIRQTSYLRYKRTVDLVVAFGLLILFAPIIVVTAVMVRVSSSGSAFFLQTRMGQFCHPYRIFKLRTMKNNAEKKSGAVWASKSDPRVTLLGKFLRKTHLDELPQLWNVIRGEMSMVGPRPERPEFLQMLEAKVPNYRKRMLVKPGVTGLAQVYLPPDSDISSVLLKTTYDLNYIQTLSLWLDLRLMLATGLQAAGFPHALVRRALLLPHPASIVGDAPLREKMPETVVSCPLSVVRENETIR